MTFYNRRDFIKVSGSTCASIVLSGNVSAWAADDQQAKAAAAIKEATGGAAIKKGAFKLVAPTIAENGAIVPMRLETSGIKKVVKLALVVDNNPDPAVFNVSIDPVLAGEGMISTRIRMLKTSNVRAFATDSDGNVYGDSKMVKVTIGGCG